MKTNSPKVPHVVLRRPHTAAGVLLLAKAIHDALAANKGMFPIPIPTLVQLGTDIAALDAAQTATQTRAKGTVQDRDAKLVVVIADLNQLRGYVQGVVNGDPTNAATIAHDAGMSLHAAPAHNKTAIAVKPNKQVSGSVDVVVKAGGAHVSHEWQYSLDGKTRTNASPTVQARTTIPGFTPGATVYVRHRAVMKTGPEPWGQTVSMIVV